MPVPSQQEQVLQLAAQPKASTRRQPPAPEPEEAKPAERKAEAVTEAKLAQQRRAPPQPEPEDATDWQAELRGYGDALSGVEAHEELAEVIEAHGSAFADAPAEIRAPPRSLRRSVGTRSREDTTDQGDNPHDRLIQRLRSEVMDGKRVVALLNALPEAEREMVSDEDRKMLTAAQKAVEQQAKGAEIEPARCSQCAWWDTSAESDRAAPGTTGQCRGAVPTADDRTGLAVWPFTDQDDWCREWEVEGSHPEPKEDDDVLPF